MRTLIELYQGDDGEWDESYGGVHVQGDKPLSVEGFAALREIGRAGMLNHAWLKGTSHP